jgi:hypothetical protein
MAGIFYFSIKIEIMEDVHISCPKCNWEPDGGAYWQCTCYYVWNTFETGGRCPACGKVWKDTQCISCDRWSPHLDWYKGLESIVDVLKEEIERGWSEPIRK